MKITRDNAETVLMAHRYRYYALNDPVISDQRYDWLDAKWTPKLGPESPLNNPGSSDRA